MKCGQGGMDVKADVRPLNDERVVFSACLVAGEDFSSSSGFFQFGFQDFIRTEKKK